MLESEDGDRWPRRNTNLTKHFFLSCLTFCPKTETNSYTRSGNTRYLRIWRGEDLKQETWVIYQKNIYTRILRIYSRGEKGHFQVLWLPSQTCLQLPLRHKIPPPQTLHPKQETVGWTVEFRTISNSGQKVLPVTLQIWVKQKISTDVLDAAVLGLLAISLIYWMTNVLRSSALMASCARQARNRLQQGQTSSWLTWIGERLDRRKKVSESLGRFFKIVPVS